MHNELSIIILAIYLTAGLDRLLLVALVSCVAIQIAYISNMDIALYYGICSMISVITAIFASGSNRGDLFSAFLLMQSIICLALIPNWSFTTNETLQFKLNDFNDIMMIIIISLCISGRDNNANTKLDNR